MGTGRLARRAGLLETICVVATRLRAPAAHMAPISLSSSSGRGAGARTRGCRPTRAAPLRRASFRGWDGPGQHRAQARSLRALFASQREHGQIAHSPADLIATPRRSSRLPRVLRAGEVAAACWTASPRRGRSRSATARCSSLPTPAGCAPRSWSRCRLADVDHEGEQLRVEGKGRKTRFVPIGEVALAALRLYLERAAGLEAAPATARGRQVVAAERPRPLAGTAQSVLCS